jgi:23S rRNA pseudouridine1911/1915/1917 synthase
MELSVLHRDQRRIVLNKPAGVPSQPDKSGDPSVLVAVRQGHGSEPPEPHAELVHRIDRRASGAVLLARTRESLRELNQALAERRIRRVYWVVPETKPRRERGHCTGWLLHDKRRNKSVCVAAGTAQAQFAELRYTTIARSERYVLLEVELITGRHHQIRAQLAEMGSPVKGDLKYGARRSNRFPGIHLHARFLEMPSGAEDDTGMNDELIRAVAPLPEEPLWQAFARALGDAAGDSGRGGAPGSGATGGS